MATGKFRRGMPVNFSGSVPDTSDFRRFGSERKFVVGTRNRGIHLILSQDQAGKEIISNNGMPVLFPASIMETT